MTFSNNKIISKLANIIQSECDRTKHIFCFFFQFLAELPLYNQLKPVVSLYSFIYDNTRKTSIVNGKSQVKMGEQLLKPILQQILPRKQKKKIIPWTGQFLHFPCM